MAFTDKDAVRRHARREAAAAVREERRLNGFSSLTGYLFEKPGKIEEAAAYIGVSPFTVSTWLKGNGSSGGETILLIEGFLRREGILPPLNLDKPPTVRQALEKAISEKLISCEDIAQAVGVPRGTLLTWVWESAEPKGEYLWRTEWLLHRKKIRPMPRLWKLPGDTITLMLAAFAPGSSLEHVAETLNIKVQRLQAWLRNDGNPSYDQRELIGQKFAKWQIQADKLKGSLGPSAYEWGQEKRETQQKDNGNGHAPEPVVAAPPLSAPQPIETTKRQVLPSQEATTQEEPMAPAALPHVEPPQVEDWTVSETETITPESGLELLRTMAQPAPKAAPTIPNVGDDGVIRVEVHLPRIWQELPQLLQKAASPISPPAVAAPSSLEEQIIFHGLMLRAILTDLMGNTPPAEAVDLIESLRQRNPDLFCDLKLLLDVAADPTRHSYVRWLNGRSKK